MKRRILSILLVLSMLTGTLASLCFPAGAATVTEGLSFTELDQYEIPYTLDIDPPASGDEAITMEMEIWFDPATSDSARVGAVFGNYRAKASSQPRCLSIEIFSGGVVRVYSNHMGDIKFTTDLRPYMGTAAAPKFAKVAVVVNASTHTLSLYVNGECKETVTNERLVSGTLVLPETLILGGDRRSGNSQYFKGRIKNLAMWGDARSASEIAADAAKDTFSVERDENLLFAYDLNRSNLTQCFTDLSGNGYHIPHEAEVAGMTFTADTYYEIPHKLNVKKPASGDEAITVEMELRVNPTSSARGGTVFGTYDENTLKNGMNIEMYSDGKLRLYTNHANDTKFSTDLRTYMGTSVAPKFAKIALVINVTTKRATLYVNGTQVESQKITAFESGDLCLPDNFILGGDMRTDNTNYFKGSLKNLAVWNDVRSASEIAADARKTEFSVESDSNLLFAYDLTKETQTECFTDLSGKGCHVIWKPQEGKSFVLGSHDKITKPLPNPPKTVEATIYMPSTVTTRGGVIIGNLTDGSSDARSNFNFEINDKGQPRLFYNKSTNVIFDKVDVRAYGTWVNVAIVCDEAQAKVICYVNGEYAQELSLGVFNANINNTTYCIGADFRTGNTPENARFKGYIKDVTLYSDVRAAEEIKSDYQNGASLTDGNVIAAWDFTSSNGFRDVTGNGYDIFNEDDGMSFTREDLYRTDGAFSTRPYTFETWLHLPTSHSSKTRGGIIFGNVLQSSDQKNALSLEIQTNGNPKLYLHNNSSSPKAYGFTFKEVDVRSDGWVHLAIVYDVTDKENMQARCYLNGALAQTMTLSDNGTNFPSGYSKYALEEMCLGGDMRDQSAPTNLTKRNEQYFKGLIHDLALFSDVRTSEEIRADYEKGIATSESGLISYYSLAGADAYEKILDRTKTGNHFTSAWELNPRENVTDYDYTFAVLGDTQKLVEQDFLKGTTYMSQIYNWIVDHREEKNIQLVMGLGDITENGHDGGDTGAEGPGEWAIAYDVITSTIGAAGIPYSLVPGNHENPTQLTQYFGNEPTLIDNVSGYYAENSTAKLGNYYMNIDVGEEKYTIVVIEYGAVDAILSWVGDVADAHPDRRVIVTTHAYMFRDGTTLDKGDVVPPDSTGEKAANNGDEMWAKLASKHRNILMVLSGHDPCENIIYRQDEGDHGNIVTQMLIDPQGMDKTYGYRTGMIALFHFSNNGRELYVEYVSAIRGEYFREENQFHLSLYPEELGDVYDIEETENGDYRVYYTGGTYQDITLTDGYEGAIAEISGYRLSLGGKIGVNAYLELPTFVEPSRVSVRFTVGEELQTVSLADAVYDERYGYAFKGAINASHLTETVTVALYYDEIMLLCDEFCAIEYAGVILENANNDPEYAAAEELVKALLRYGTAAQNYFGENTDAPADAILDESDRALGEHKDGIDGLASFTCTGEVTGAEYVSTTLELRDGTTMYHYFTVTEGVEYTVTCATAMLDCELVDGRVAVKVLDIDAANLATTYTLTLANGAETLTVSANAFAYARAVLASESASPALKTLMNALYEYYAAAAAYNA